MASVNDKFIKTSVVGATKLSSPLSQSGSTLAVESVAGWHSDTAIIAVIDRVNAQGELTPEKMEIVLGTLSGSGLENLRRGVGGTQQAHSTGAVVELSIASSEQWNRLIDAMIIMAGQDGKLKEAAFDKLNPSIPGEAIKDGSIEPAKIRNAGALTGTAQFQKLPEQSWSAGSWQKKNGSDLTFTTTQPNQKVVLLASLQFYQGGYSKARWKIDNAYTNIIQFNSGIANTTTASQTLMIVHTVPTPGTHSASLEISAGGSLRIIDGEGSANYAVFPALG